MPVTQMEYTLKRMKTWSLRLCSLILIPGLTLEPAFTQSPRMSLRSNPIAKTFHEQAFEPPAVLGTRYTLGAQETRSRSASIQHALSPRALQPWMLTAR